MQAGQWKEPSEFVLYKSTHYRQLLRKSQDITGITQQVRKHIWYWTGQINPGSDIREVTAFNFWRV